MTWDPNSLNLLEYYGDNPDFILDEPAVPLPAEEDWDAEAARDPHPPFFFNSAMLLDKLPLNPRKLHFDS